VARAPREDQDDLESEPLQKLSELENQKNPTAAKFEQGVQLSGTATTSDVNRLFHRKFTEEPETFLNSSRAQKSETGQIKGGGINKKRLRTKCNLGVARGRRRRRSRTRKGRKKLKQRRRKDKTGESPGYIWGRT
jgi:hypothetical protein